MGFFRDSILAGSATALLSAWSAAQQPTAPETTPQKFQDGPIRVFYQLTGKHAVNPADTNHNGVPDQVEDAVTQIKAARLFYCQLLGFTDPFTSPRYQGVSFLDVEFREKETLQGNGKAYDELRPSRRKGDPENTRILRIGLATSAMPTANPTPAHEFFHLIQYGATFFKNRWWTEGTARWSQRPFGPDGAGPARRVDPWPLSAEQRELIVAMAYDASAFFWKPLAERYDPEGLLPSSAAAEELRAMTYVDGSKVWKNDRLPGWRLIRAVMQQLDLADDKALHELGRSDWKEEFQRSAENNRFMFEAIGLAIQSLSTPK